MRHMREKVQTKLNAMASILIDDILVPEQQEQEGAETVMASYYDKFGNKFTFTLGLTVVPNKKDDAEVEEPVSIQDQVSLILEKLTSLEEDVSVLKSYHAQENSGSENSETNPIITEPTESTGSEGDATGS